MFTVLIFCSQISIGQTNETLSSGSYIINMGKSPQTTNNALRPYGMVYDLLKNYQVPIKWVINPTKGKDGTDFTHNGVTYKGGAFIIPAEYRTSGVNSRISYWQGQGVVGASTVAPITVPVHTTLFNVPRWVLDQQNGKIAQDFFSMASIPSSAHGGSNPSGWKKPSQLNCCDDLFVMPHADPKWSTHGNLLSWNLNCKGGIWLGCHAGSALEDMFNPSNKSQQTNFLAEKTGTATGNGPYSENALVLWDNHDDGTLPYSYDYHSDPIMQFLGTIDAATTNGSEQIYITKNPGWRPTTRVGVYDPNHPERPSNAIQHRAALLVWGPGFGDSDRGLVMIAAAHDLAKESKPANIAAIRSFFNFSLIALSDKAVLPSISGLPVTISSGSNASLSFSVPPPALVSNFSATWTSSCGGTFSPNNTSSNVTFTAPNVNSPTGCMISLVIEDPCGRETFDSKIVTVTNCSLNINYSTVNVCAGGSNNGSIAMNITGGTTPYSYTWNKIGGGTGSGTGTVISGLTAGGYNVTVTSANGCEGTFQATIKTSSAINIASTVQQISCNGANDGAINLTVTGGVPSYTYNWGAGITTKNRSNLSPGTYTVTVTDANSCTNTASFTLANPTAIAITPSVTNLNCFNQQTGAISLSVSGGTSPYSYLWNDGSTLNNRSGLAAGTYAVTVTDNNNCLANVNGIVVTQPNAALSASLNVTNSSCNGAGDGSITAVVTGGTSPYTYDWSGNPSGDGTATITGLAAGTYNLTITDANTCTLVATAVVSESSDIQIIVNSTDPTCPVGSNPPLNSDGSISLTVSGGNPYLPPAQPYTYSWSDNPGALTGTRTNLTAGVYMVTVMDELGCSASATIVLENLYPDPVQPGVINNN
jgi:hypothetical protein